MLYGRPSAEKPHGKQIAGTLFSKCLNGSADLHVRVARMPFRRLLISMGDAAQHRLAEPSASELDAARQTVRRKAARPADPWSQLTRQISVNRHQPLQLFVPVQDNRDVDNSRALCVGFF